MVIITSFVVFEIALVEQVFDRALLVVLDVAMDEDVRDGDADGDADDDRDGLDAVAHHREQCGCRDVLDVEQGEEHAVEQHTRDHRDGGRDGQDDVWRVEPVDGLEGEETDNGGAEEGAGRLREAELQDHDVAQQDCDDAADRDDGQQAPRDVEDDGEAHRGDGGGDGLREVDVVRPQADSREDRDIAEPDGDDDA